MYASVHSLLSSFGAYLRQRQRGGSSVRDSSAPQALGAVDENTPLAFHQQLHLQLKLAFRLICLHIMCFR